MPTGTYVLIASNVLSSSASSVTFSSIPTTGYRDLIVVIEHTQSTTGGGNWRINGDTGSNYNSASMAGTNGTTSSSSTANGTSFGFYYALANEKMLTLLQIMDYAVTDKHKSVLQRGNYPASSNSTFPVVEGIAGRWASTSAVTSLTFTPAGNFQSGSTFYLYGIVS